MGTVDMWHPEAGGPATVDDEAFPGWQTHGWVDHPPEVTSVPKKKTARRTAGEHSEEPDRG